MRVRSIALSLAIAWAGVSAPVALAQSAAPATKASTAKPVTTKPAATKPAAAKAAPAKASASKSAAAKPVEVAPGQPVSGQIIDLANWIVATSDNRGLPFAVVDKYTAQILVFGVDGKVKGMAPILIGSAVGDESAPGVGDRELRDIPRADRTTPAGRFVSGFGPAAGGERVLWIDYANSVSIHPTPATATSKKEKRKERLTSPAPDDNRITHGCINVSATFYQKTITKVFKKGGVFYVLPETMTVEEAFPGYLPPAQLASTASPTGR